MSAGAGSSEPTLVRAFDREVGVAQEAGARNVPFLVRRGAIGDVENDDVGVLELCGQLGDGDEHGRIGFRRPLCGGRRDGEGESESKQRARHGASCRVSTRACVILADAARPSASPRYSAI